MLFWWWCIFQHRFIFAEFNFLLLEVWWNRAVLCLAIHVSKLLHLNYIKGALRRGLCLTCQDILVSVPVLFWRVSGGEVYIKQNIFQLLCQYGELWDSCIQFYLSNKRISHFCTKQHTLTNTLLFCINKWIITCLTVCLWFFHCHLYDSWSVRYSFVACTLVFCCFYSSAFLVLHL
jgi:hypothetical protein